MPSITGTDLTTIRQNPSHVKRYLSFAPLEQVFSCQVDTHVTKNAASGGVISFTYNNGVGNPADALPGYTVWIGTTAGARDIGVTRVRKAISGSTFFVAETSWGKLYIQDNHYVTVFRDVRIWAKAPRLVGVKNGSNFVNSFTEYHDYDLAYTNQNSQIRPKANITRSSTDRRPPKPADFVDDGETFRTVTVSAAFSIAMATSATITGYLWDVEDGTITVGSTSTQDITVTFPASQEYRLISLTVTDSNGQTQIMFWPIWVYLRTTPPSTSFQITNDTRGLGREMGFEIFGADDSADETVIPEGSLVCYWEETTFDNDPAPSQYIDAFIGWTMDDSITLKRNNRSRYAITVGGPQAWLSRLNGYAQKVSNKSPVNRWFKMAAITVDRIAHYILREYSTVLSVCNLYLSGITTTVMAEEFKKSDIWGQITELEKGNEVCNTACDSLGSIWFRSAYEYLELADRAAVSIIINLTPSDIVDSRSLVLAYDKLDRTSVVSMSGSFVTGGKNKLVYSKAPALVPAQSGNDEEGPFQRLDGDGQQRLNQLSGHHYAKVNEPLRQVDIELIGNLDIFERAWGEPITISWTYDSIRGTILNVQEFVIDSISVSHSNEFGTAPKKITLTVSKATRGNPGVSYFPPVNNNKLSVPSIQFPKINWPVFQTYEWTGYNLPPSVPSMALFTQSSVADENYIYIANQTFDLGQPTYERFLTDGANDVKLGAACADPFSPYYLGTGTTVNGYLLMADKISRITDVFGARILTTQHTFDPADLIVSDFGTAAIAYSKGVSGWLIATAKNYRYDPPRNEVYYTTDGGLNWIKSSFYMGGFSFIHLSSKIPGKAYLGVDQQLYETSDFGDTWTLKVDGNAGGQSSKLLNCRWLHVPEHNNPNDNIIFFAQDGNWSSLADPATINFLYRGNLTDLSHNSIASVSWPSGGYRIEKLVTNPTNRGLMVALSYPGWRSGSGTGYPTDMHLSFSYNGGNTWPRQGLTEDCYIIKMSISNPDYIYIAGGTSKEDAFDPTFMGYVAVSRDFGRDLEGRTGNFESFTSPGVGPILEMMGA